MKVTFWLKAAAKSSRPAWIDAAPVPVTAPVTVRAPPPASRTPVFLRAPAMESTPAPDVSINPAFVTVFLADPRVSEPWAITVWPAASVTAPKEAKLAAAPTSTVAKF